MKKEAWLMATILLLTIQAAAQNSSLYFGAGTSVNHITMDVAPALVPNFDVLHRISVNAEVLYGYKFPNRWQFLAGAGVFSFKYGVEAGDNIQPHKPSFPDKYFIRKNWADISTITPFYLTAGGAYTFLQGPRFEAEASLMVDAVYLKSLNLLPLENSAKGVSYLFDQYNYNTGWNLYLQPGARLKRITRYNFAYWIKAKASLRSGSVLEVKSSSLEQDNQNYEATIRTSGSTFALLAGVEVPLFEKAREKKIADPIVFNPGRQLITARVGLSQSYPALKEDSGGQLQDSPHIGGYVGVLLEERLKGPFYIGIGLTNYTFSEFYNFTLPSGFLPGGSSGSSLFGIPFTLAWYQASKNWSFRLAGGVGYILPFTSKGSNIYSASTTDLDDSNRFNYEAKAFVANSSTPYMDIDVSGSYSLSRRIALHSFVGYSYGFKKFLHSQVTYQYNNEQEQTARMDFGLSHLNFGLGLRYAFSKN